MRDRIRDRFSHLPPEKRERYRIMFEASPTVYTGQHSVTAPQGFPEKKIDYPLCKYRGGMLDEVKLRQCCGQRLVNTVQSFSCELLKCVCIRAGTPADRGIESCATCSDFEPAK